MTIELTKEQYEEILESIPYISDGSYAYRVARIIEEALREKLR